MLFMTSRVISKGSRRGWMMDWGAEGASRWVSRESEVKWQLDVADLSRSRVAGRAVKENKKKMEAGSRSETAQSCSNRRNCGEDLIIGTVLNMFDFSHTMMF